MFTTRSNIRNYSHGPQHEPVCGRSPRSPAGNPSARRPIFDFVHLSGTSGCASTTYRLFFEYGETPACSRFRTRRQGEFAIISIQVCEWPTQSRLQLVDSPSKSEDMSPSPASDENDEDMVRAANNNNGDRKPPQDLLNSQKVRLKSVITSRATL